MLRDVLVLRRRGAHAFVINAGSHVDHEIRVAWFSNSMHACGSAPLIINKSNILNRSAQWQNIF